MPCGPPQRNPVARSELYALTERAPDGRRLTMAVLPATSAALTPESPPSRQAPSVVPFFVALFLCTWLVVDPSLLYGCTSFFPAFTPGRAFAANFFWCPGGVVKYLAALLYQVYYYAWAGALVTTVVAAALYWSAHLIDRSPALGQGRTGRCLPQ